MLVLPIDYGKLNFYPHWAILGRIREFVAWSLLFQTVYPSATLSLSEDHGFGSLMMPNS